MKCKDCLSSKCKYAAEFGEGDCWYESNLPSDSWFFKLHKEKRNTDFDWQSFRAEVVKDILCAVISGGISSGAGSIIPEKENLVKVSIDIANELVKQLKEKEEK